MTKKYDLIVIGTGSAGQSQQQNVIKPAGMQLW